MIKLLIINFKKNYLLLVLLNCFFSFSQEAKIKLTDPTRTTLTGDWSGTRPWLTANGITILPRITSFYEGMTSGDGNKKFEFGGKADVQIIFNGEKLGLWKGLKIVTHTELNYGKSTNGYGGVLLPKNTALAFPGMNGSDYFDISSLFISQSIGRNSTLMVGKINMVDIAAGTPFSGGAGIDNFLNVAFAAPPSGLVPPYIFGSLLVIKTDPINYTFGIYDPVSVVNKSGLENPFKSGVTFFSSIEKPIKIAQKMGAHSIKVVFSTHDGISLESLDDNLILPPSVANEIVTKNSRYYVGYSFNQYLVQPNTNVDKGWGIFGTVGFSDGDPTPIDWSFLLGIGGNSPIENRGNDLWGIGYFHTSISGGLKESAQTASLDLNDESGFEAFYNVQLMPWFQVGVDFQLINPLLNKNKSASFIGLRSSIQL